MCYTSTYISLPLALPFAARGGGGEAVDITGLEKDLVLTRCQAFLSIIQTNVYTSETPTQCALLPFVGYTDSRRGLIEYQTSLMFRSDFRQE